ncbi:MAG: hypothetical protein CMP22_07140 [Rickettsiales bacterium]|nr:hypothetical protein [Rickettsiales bacterium]
MNDINRQDTGVHTARPQGLIDLIWYWEKYGCIGSPLELMRKSVERRLVERRPNTEIVSNISKNKVREGLKLIAAACTLMKEAVIAIPDEDNNVGIDIRKLLSNWKPDECNTVLGRPIFGGAIYGAVRLDRPTRDFLTAEWLNDCLKRGAPRKDIENLFFQKTYGVKVLVPSMRSVLSWLMIFDEEIRAKACKIEPEIIFDSGDPTQFPLEVRSKILKSICRKISLDASQRSVTDYASIERFTSPDMSKDVKVLLKKYKNNTEIVSFLMRMIWRGKIIEALPETKILALDSQNEKYARVLAIKALKEIGSKEDFKELLDCLKNQDKKIDRRILAGVIDVLEPTQNSIDWVFDALAKVKEKEKYTTEGLTYSLVSFVERLDLKLMHGFINRCCLLLDKKPFIQKRGCEVSKRFGWLINCAGKAIERLLLVRHKDALMPESLDIIYKISSFTKYEYFQIRSLTKKLPEIADDWSDLNFALFWKDVEETRKNFSNDLDDRITDFSRVYGLREYWNFGLEDFENIKNEIINRSFLDDKLVALTLAFQIYVENNRPNKLKEELNEIVFGVSELEELLSTMLKPPPQSNQQKKFKKEEQRWQLENKKREDDLNKYHADWLIWLKENVELLKDENRISVTLSNGGVLGAHKYLLERMRHYSADNMKWTQGNWEDLKGVYGVDIATAFRDGLVMSWRHYKPDFPSERNCHDRIPLAVIVGLSGLEIDSKENKNWANGLSEGDVELACRYAFYELNGFPAWFARLHKVFPDLVNDYIMKEIDWELGLVQEGKEKHYLIDKLSWGNENLWDSCAPLILERLEKEPASVKKLGYLLKIIQWSRTISDREIASLASKKCDEIENLDHLSYWFATWIGVEPEKAIQRFSEYLKKVKKDKTSLSLAMRVIVNLVGDEFTDFRARTAYRQPKYLKLLYLLMHKYIKVEEDIDRIGKGAYSPQLRDNAQNARESLFNVLTNIQGKESYIALVELAKKHPVKKHRPWMMRAARKCAEKDTDIKVWNYANIHRLIDSFKEKVSYQMNFWEKILGFGFGVTFIVVLLVIALFITDPTETQHATFKTILALSAAGIGGIFTGFIHVEGKINEFTIRAGGALALFVIVYFFPPEAISFMR